MFDRVARRPRYFLPGDQQRQLIFDSFEGMFGTEIRIRHSRPSAGCDLAIVSYVDRREDSNEYSSSHSLGIRSSFDRRRPRHARPPSAPRRERERRAPRLSRRPISGSPDAGDSRSRSRSLRRSPSCRVVRASTEALRQPRSTPHPSPSATCRSPRVTRCGRSRSRSLPMQTRARSCPIWCTSTSCRRWSCNLGSGSPSPGLQRLTEIAAPFAPL